MLKCSLTRVRFDVHYNEMLGRVEQSKNSNENETVQLDAAVVLWIGDLSGN